MVRLAVTVAVVDGVVQLAVTVPVVYGVTGLVVVKVDVVDGVAGLDVSMNESDGETVPVVNVMESVTDASVTMQASSESVITTLSPLSQCFNMSFRI